MFGRVIQSAIDKWRLGFSEAQQMDQLDSISLDGKHNSNQLALADSLKDLSGWAHLDRKPRTDPNRTETEPNNRFFSFLVRFWFLFLETSVIGSVLGLYVEGNRRTEQTEHSTYRSASQRRRKAAMHLSQEHLGPITQAHSASPHFHHSCSDPIRSIPHFLSSTRDT
jgi:hypothetical protein